MVDEICIRLGLSICKKILSGLFWRGLALASGEWWLHQGQKTSWVCEYGWGNLSQCCGV
jgi:hypothetical protein